MFYLFFMGCEKSVTFEQLKQAVFDNIPEQSVDDHKLMEDCEKSLRIVCKYYDLTVGSCNMGTKFRCEDYDMELCFKFLFDVNRSDEKWMKEMLSFVGKLMKIFDGDCAFESKGDSPPIMYRKNDVVIVDDSGLHGYQRFPFHHLGVEYQEGNTMDLLQIK